MCKLQTKDSKKGFAEGDKGRMINVFKVRKGKTNKQAKENSK